MTAPTFLDPRLWVNVEAEDFFMRIIPAAENSEGVYFYTHSTEYPIEGGIKQTIKRFASDLTEITPTVEFDSESYGWRYRALARPDGGLYVLGYNIGYGDGRTIVRGIEPNGLMSPSSQIVAGSTMFDGSGSTAICLPDDSLIIAHFHDGAATLYRVAGGVAVDSVALDDGEFTYPPTFDQQFPLQGAVLSNGNFVVSWLRRVSAFPYRVRAYYAVFDPTDLSMVEGPFSVSDEADQSNCYGMFGVTGGFMLLGVGAYYDGSSWSNSVFGRRCSNDGTPLTVDFDAQRIGHLVLMNTDHTLWYATEGNRLRKFGPNRNPDGLLTFERAVQDIGLANDGKMLVLTMVTTGGGEGGGSGADWVVEAIDPGGGNSPPALVMAVRVG